MIKKTVLILLILALIALITPIIAYTDLSFRDMWRSFFQSQGLM